MTTWFERLCCRFGYHDWVTVMSVDSRGNQRIHRWCSLCPKRQRRNEFWLTDWEDF